MGISKSVFGVVLATLLGAGCNSDSTKGGDGDGDGEKPGVYNDPAIQAVLDLPTPALSYAVTLPRHFTVANVDALDNTPPTNPVTNVGATLGRVLFYDPALSANDTIACASCHQKDFAFSDPSAASVGFDGGLTPRNSMSLVNVRFYGRGRMFWDERAATLEDQVLQPIQNEVEMGITLPDLEAKLAATAHYPLLFEQAFGDSAITSERISLALAQFVRSIVSSGSPYDTGVVATPPNQPFANFTAEENAGKALFFGAANCAVCHLPPGPGGPGPNGNVAVFYVDAPRNNGLTALNTGDQGVGDVTGNPLENGLFKSSELRNVELTAPYMHDGSLATLRDVIEHYNSGVEAHPNLDPRLRQGGPGGPPQQLNLTSGQMDDLEAFLKTLTDTSTASAQRFADPFR